MHNLRYFVLALLASSILITWPLDSFAFQESVLATGKWVKIEVQSRGVYRITRQDLLGAGFSATELDPSQIKLYGNGGKMVPQRNSDSRPFDLLENSIYVSGAGDGSFDDGDFILFYADGPDNFQFNQDNSLLYKKNSYSNSSFYFLTVGNDSGLRIQDRTSEGTSFQNIDFYNHIEVHELEENNILQALITSYGGSGREWYGEQFKQQLIQNFSFAVDNLYESGNTILVTSLLAASKATTSFQTKLNGTLLGNQTIQAIPDSRYGVKGRSRVDTFMVANSSLGVVQNLNVELQYSPANTLEDAGYLDYLLLISDKKLIKGNSQLFFQNLLTNTVGSFTYSISNLTGTDFIWDITDPMNPVSQSFETSGNTGQFGLSANELHRFVAFNPSDAATPASISPLANQNLHSLATPEFLIITNQTFRPEAERLATFRQSNDGLSSSVVLVSEIFNEFGSGSPDPTAIRDFVKHLHDKSPVLKYLLFFGKTSYDPKDRIQSNTNFVPTYISRNSLDPLRSYTSDDYFGFLEDDEGEWIETISGDHTVDIGIGRLPVKTLSEAQGVVDKIIDYSSSLNSLGKHLNEVYFIGDFGDGNYHMDQSNQLAILVDTTFSDFHSNRIFLDNYELVVQPGRNSFPGASKKLTEIINTGALIVNYTGHGGEEGLSNQFLLRTPDLSKWENAERLPLLVTATCEFGRHDDPFRISAGELALLKPDGGCIALVTTARPVFASTNFELNKAFYGRVFKKENNAYPRLGDVFVETKNNSLNGPNNRNFSLLGDPSMRLAYPKNSLVVESINGKPANSSDTLSRLTQVQVTGRITDQAGTDLSNYSGTLYAKVYDKPSQLQTLGQDTQPFNYMARENILFSGTASIDQGLFDFEFILPKDLSSDIGSTKMVLYASSENTLEDANGASLQLKVGGENANPGSDTTPPNVELYMEDTTFRNGGVTGASTLLLVRLDDESGINLLPGQFELKAILDNDAELSLAEYFEADLESYTGGWVLLPIDGLVQGFHSITVFASDVYNNQTESVINFRVENERRLIISDLINYPNPIFDETTFKFNHNRSGDNLYIQISIITVSGEIVQNLEWQVDNAPTTVDGLEWNNGNFSGKNLTPGVYVGRLLVRSRIDGAKNQAFRRLLIIK